MDPMLQALQGEVPAGPSPVIQQQPQQAVDPMLDALMNPASAPKAVPASPSMDSQPEQPGRWRQLGTNAANYAIGGVADALLNAPTNVLNLAKAAVGAPLVAMGRPDLAPEPTPTPYFATRALTAAGTINPQIQPQTPAEKLYSSGISGATAGVMNPAGSVPQMVGNAVNAGLSNAAGNIATQVTGSEPVGQAVSMLTPAAINAAQRVGQNKIDQMKAVSEQNAQRDKTLRDAQALGMGVPPSAVNPTFVGNRAEGMAGKAALNQDFSHQNQKVANAVARQEAGLKPNQAITEEALSDVRDKVSWPYRELEKLPADLPIFQKPFSHPAETLKELREARFEANRQFRFYDRSGDPAAQDKAFAAQRKADLLEQSLERAAIASGKPELVPELRAARTQIAKTYDVERALNIGTGDVSARLLGKSLDRGKPLTGGLATVGRFAEAFPAYNQEGAKASTPAVSKLEALASLGSAAAGHALLGPWGVTAAALPFAGEAIRPLMLSRFGQNYLSQPNYSVGSVPSLLSKLPISGNPAFEAGILANLPR